MVLPPLRALALIGQLLQLRFLAGHHEPHHRLRQCRVNALGVAGTGLKDVRNGYF